MIFERLGRFGTWVQKGAWDMAYWDERDGLDPEGPALFADEGGMG